MLLEIVCGILSGASVAPLVAIVDEAIFSNASGKATILNSIRQSFSKLFKHPIVFIRGTTFLWIWMVYGSKYVVSNCVERYLIQKRAKSISTSPTKFIATSATNIGMSVLKDRVFTRMFGTTKPRPIPARSLACYTIRDAMTIAASFTFVEPVGNMISDKFGIERHSSTTIAQIFCPLLAQTLNTPIFLYGMNLYNNPNSNNAEHRKFIREQYMKTLACRVARIAPAFSIGGVLNRALRKISDKWRSQSPALV